jgi:hypothetical protein
MPLPHHATTHSINNPAVVLISLALALGRGNNHAPMRVLFTRVDFDWMVASKGYTVVEQDNGLPRIVPLKGSVHVVTRPFHQFPGLFKQFAALEATSSGVVKFSNKFGLLENEANETDLNSWFQYANDSVRL